MHLLKMAAAAVTDMEENVKKRIDAEIEVMALEDRRSRQVRTLRLSTCAVNGGQGVPSVAIVLLEERLPQKNN